MKKITNNTHLEGYLFGHDLELRVAGEAAKNPGAEFISGTLQIATDEEANNVVPVRFGYIPPKWKSGKENTTFKALMAIMSNPGTTYQEVKTEATKLRIDTTLGLNEFYSREGELISYKINDAGFLHIVNALTDNRNNFEVDVLIKNVEVLEADEDKDLPERATIQAATFNFRGDILPLELTVESKGGISYFEDLGATPSEPVFVKVWGHIASSTLETQTTEESAFGEPQVKITSRSFRNWIVTGAAPDAYDFGSEEALTRDEVKAAIAARETYLAEMKDSQEKRDAAKKTGGTAAAGAGAPNPGKFDF